MDWWKVMHFFERNAIRRFSKIREWSCEVGSFARVCHAAGRPTMSKTPALDEAASLVTEQHSEKGSTTIPTNLHCSHKLVWVILKKQ